MRLNSFFIGIRCPWVCSRGLVDGNIPSLNIYPLGLGGERALFKLVMVSPNIVSLEPLAWAFQAFNCVPNENDPFGQEMRSYYFGISVSL